jgi:hypothetical protein
VLLLLFHLLLLLGSTKEYQGGEGTTFVKQVFWVSRPEVKTLDSQSIVGSELEHRQLRQLNESGASLLG